MRDTPIWPDPRTHLMRHAPDEAMVYFCPSVLQATAQRFRSGFDGLVSYAVKANPGGEVLANLVTAGIRAFDVASPAEMQAVRAICPEAALHYHNPVRSLPEIAEARRLGALSYSVDAMSELDKLTDLPAGTEIAVRLALPVSGAAYDFGAKFGATPEAAEALLRNVAARGLTPSMTFHPGTQCADPSAWGSYIAVVARIAERAGVTLARLNVGGGFAAHRGGQSPDLEAIFDHIRTEVDRRFKSAPPALVCEPGRAMVSDAFTLVARVKALRGSGAVFLNDGLYGGLFEARDIGCTSRVRVMTADGAWRQGACAPREVFGPTCDSLDRLPDPLDLPTDLAEGDFVFFEGMGAYSNALSTRFNGYGLGAPVTVASL